MSGGHDEGEKETQQGKDIPIAAVAGLGIERLEACIHGHAAQPRRF
jgi:hypothetical protein